jgi:predicted acyltransferase
MRRSPATTIYLALTGIFVLGAFLQPFTFGLGYFGASDGYDLHEILGGGVLHGISLLALIAALASPDRRRDAPWALGLFVLVTVQIILPDQRDDAAALAALHPLLGVTAIGMAGWMHLLARRPPGAPAPA